MWRGFTFCSGHWCEVRYQKNIVPSPSPSPPHPHLSPSPPPLLRGTFRRNEFVIMYRDCICAGEMEQSARNKDPKHRRCIRPWGRLCTRSAASGRTTCNTFISAPLISMEARPVAHFQPREISVSWTTLMTFSDKRDLTLCGPNNREKFELG